MTRKAYVNRVRPVRLERRTDTMLRTYGTEEIVDELAGRLAEGITRDYRSGVLEAQRVVDKIRINSSLEASARTVGRSVERGTAPVTKGPKR